MQCKRLTLPITSNTDHNWRRRRRRGGAECSANLNLNLTDDEYGYSCEDEDEYLLPLTPMLASHPNPQHTRNTCIYELMTITTFRRIWGRTTNIVIIILIIKCRDSQERIWAFCWTSFFRVLSFERKLPRANIVGTRFDCFCQIPGNLWSLTDSSSSTFITFYSHPGNISTLSIMEPTCGIWGNPLGNSTTFSLNLYVNLAGTLPHKFPGPLSLKTLLSKQSPVRQGKSFFGFDMCLTSRSLVSRLAPLFFVCLTSSDSNFITSLN